MNPTSNLPFGVKVIKVEHDKRLVRRYLLQSAFRVTCGVFLMLAVAIYLPAILLLPEPGHDLLRPASWTFTGLFWSAFYPVFVPAMSALGMARRNLMAWRDAGTPLTRELMASRVDRTVVSSFDPMSTFDLCAETLSGLAVGEALGYGGPAVFWHSAFQGKILLGPWRPLWLGRSIEVLIAGQPGQPVQIRIRRRPVIDFFLVQNGNALRAVETVTEHLQVRLQQRERALMAAKREQELERSALHAKLSALQAQVEPHFLFNTLANLKYLIRTDAGAAQQMLDHLVGYLQNALPDMRSVSSTVQRELDLARAYLSIMQIRMGNRLRFRIDADDGVLALPLPPAMLISLVENAVKHGLERASRPGEIAIGAEVRGGSLRVTVRDDGAGLTDQSGQGFGLANIHERLALLYGERASLSVSSAEPCGVEAVLTVPLKES
jgi:signal transduction histidine kinase